MSGSESFRANGLAMKYTLGRWQIDGQVGLSARSPTPAAFATTRISPGDSAGVSAARPAPWEADASQCRDPEPFPRPRTRCCKCGMDAAARSCLLAFWSSGWAIVRSLGGRTPHPDRPYVILTGGQSTRGRVPVCQPG